MTATILAEMTAKQAAIWVLIVLGIICGVLFIFGARRP